MKRIVAIGAAACLVLAGCAQFYRPEVDLKGADRAKYEADLAECRDEASETPVEGESPAPIFGAALLMGLIGAAIGAASIPYDGGTGAARGAAIFGALGAALGGVFVASKQAEAQTIRAGIIDTCLHARGYTVRS
ncbi:MAG: hypothetical protein ACE5FR_00600 [Rhodospirillales bacterium]